MELDKAEKTMIDNLHKNTGKTLEQWIEIVKKENFEKHGQIMKFLKESHSLSHGFANLVALKARGADAGSVENKDDLIDKQYKGKENLRPLYDTVIIAGQCCVIGIVSHKIRGVAHHIFKYNDGHN